MAKKEFKISTESDLLNFKVWIDSLYKDTVMNMGGIPFDIDPDDFMGLGYLNIEVNYEHKE